MEIVAVIGFEQSIPDRWKKNHCNGNKRGNQCKCMTYIEKNIEKIYREMYTDGMASQFKCMTIKFCSIFRNAITKLIFISLPYFECLKFSCGIYSICA